MIPVRASALHFASSALCMRTRCVCHLGRPGCPSFCGYRIVLLRKADVNQRHESLKPGNHPTPGRAEQGKASGPVRFVQCMHACIACMQASNRLDRCSANHPMHASAAKQCHVQEQAHHKQCKTCIRCRDRWRASHAPACTRCPTYVLRAAPVHVSTLRPDVSDVVSQTPLSTASRQPAQESGSSFVVTAAAASSHVAELGTAAAGKSCI